MYRLNNNKFFELKMISVLLGILGIINDKSYSELYNLTLEIKKVKKNETTSLSLIVCLAYFIVLLDLFEVKNINSQINLSSNIVI